MIQSPTSARTAIQQGLLVGDIGGTNARFALVDGANQILATQTLKVSAYPTFEGALAAFLEGADVTPRAACFAVAGPVVGGEARFTNAPWKISAEGLRHDFGFSDAFVVNDFEALSRFALSPQPADLRQIKDGLALPGAPVLTIGPGTGLGQGLVMPHPHGPVPIATEGGHVVLAATNEEEAALIAVVASQLKRPVSAEDLVCGSGLVRLHNCMALRDGRTVPAATPETITDGAKAGDPLYLATLNQFCAFLGTVTANAALVTGARGGVMVAGGILPRVPDVFEQSPFAAHFVGNSAMADYLAAIPVHLLVAGDAALRGAACLLSDHL